MISSIRLQNFRSYRDASFEFEPGANIIVGPNASGKTNLLEAVMVLAGQSSYRAKDTELVRFDKQWARLDGFFGGESRSFKLELNQQTTSKTYVIGERTYKRLSLDHVWPIVYFEPEHLQAIIRGPDRRRDYFDDLLERTVPGFKQIAANYRRTLAQRNSLLKKGRGGATSQIFAWDIRLGELGSKIASARHDLIDRLNKDISKTYSQIAAKKTLVTTRYNQQFPLANYASQMVSMLEKKLENDLTRGFTGYGPHREDFTFYINGQNIALAASRGEVRSLLLSLKKIELALVEAARDQKPIILLDDVFSELDGTRRMSLVQIIGDHQAILTTTDADAAVKHFGKNTKLIPL